MTAFTMPELITGVPLWVPDEYDYFDIEDAAMPNGDPCLAVRGDVSTAYKAFQMVPTLSPYNIFNQSDMTTLASSGNGWSMSVWLKLANLASNAPSNALMFGWSGQDAAGFWNNTGRNATTPFIMGPTPGVKNGFQVYREPLNNISSPDHFKTSFLGGSFENFQEYWTLFVYEIHNDGAGNLQANVYMDTYPGTNGNDATCSISGTPGLYSPGRYLYIGSYPLASVGRADLWRMAKWAFHDHVLTQAERQSMWEAMYVDHATAVYVDDFNDSVVGPNWGNITTASTMTMDGSVATSASSGLSGGRWVRDLGSTKHYAEAIFSGTTGDWNEQVGCRLPAYSPGISTGYWGGWNGFNAQWQIVRNSTVVATASTGPSYPHTTRLEVEPGASDSVDIRLYEDGVLKLSYNDTNAARILTGSNAGLQLRANGSTLAKATNFECGRF